MNTKFLLFYLLIFANLSLQAADCEVNGRFTYLWRIGSKIGGKVPAGSKIGTWYVPITFTNCPLPPVWASSVVNTACNEWNNSTGFNPVYLAYQGLSNGPNLQRNAISGNIGFVAMNGATQDEVNLIGNPRDPQNRKLAIAYAYMETKDYNCGEGDEYLNPIADDVDILFNPKWQWGSVLLPPVGVSGNNVVDFESVVKHEIGHLLGLGHWNGIGFSGLAVMRSKISKGDINSIIRTNDIDQLERLYTFDKFSSPVKPYIPCDCFTKSAYVECRLKSGCGSDVDQSSCSRDGYCSPGSTCGHGGTSCSKKPGEPGPKCRKSKLIDDTNGLNNEMTRVIIKLGIDELKGNLLDLSDVLALNFEEVKKIGEEHQDNFALQASLIETYNHLIPLIEVSLVEGNIAIVQESDVAHFCTFLDLYSNVCKDKDLKLAFQMLKRALPTFVGKNFKDALIKYDRMKYEEIMALPENKCTLEYADKALYIESSTYTDGTKGVINIKANYEFSLSYEVVNLLTNSVKYESSIIEFINGQEKTEITESLSTGYYRVIPTINSVRRTDLAKSFSIINSN